MIYTSSFSSGNGPQPLQIADNVSLLWPCPAVIGALFLIFARELRITAEFDIHNGKGSVLRTMRLHMSETKALELAVSFDAQDLSNISRFRNRLSSLVSSKSKAHRSDSPGQSIFIEMCDFLEELVTRMDSHEPIGAFHHQDTDSEVSRALPDGTHKCYFVAASSPDGNMSEYLPPWKMVLAETFNEVILRLS